MHALQRDFSHIYIEEAVAELAETHHILSRFPRAQQIPIDDYKEILNRPSQDWRSQKLSQKLVLAGKKQEFLYPGVDVTPSFGYEHFYYNTLVLNCLYDCHYCYLQGMYPSSNIVFFVNLEQFFAETSAALRTQKPMYLCISYDTDLMALEHIYPYCQRWIEFAGENPDLIIELRTKSANWKVLRELAPQKNAIIAWTLSPQSIIDSYEPRTASLKARLAAAAALQQAGWPVRLCFDPVLLTPGWEETYRELVEETFSTLDPTTIRDISVGSFRINKTYFKRMKKVRSDSDLLYQGFESTDDIISYPEKIETELVGYVSEQVGRFVDPEKVKVVDYL